MLTKEQIEAASELVYSVAWAEDGKCDECEVLEAALAAYSRVAVLIDEMECKYGDDCPDHGTRHGRCLPCKLRRALEG